jgi:carbamoyl-phosphate synthase large subunit
MRILVTGCGGDIAQSIGKLLKQVPEVTTVVGCDLHQEHAGHFIFGKCFIVSRASSPDYLGTLYALIKENGIDVLIPSTEFELKVFLEQKPEMPCTVVKPNDKSLQIGLDKFATASFLKQHGLPYPTTHLAEEDFLPVFPCMVKARTGSGSKSVHIVRDRETLDLLTKLYSGLVYQEYLSDAHEEYTCGLFRDKSKNTRSVIFRRKLTGGFSSYGEVVYNKSITELLESLARSIDLQGSINVQLRIDKGIPKIFEINPRFSSTVLCRHLLGFKDVVWSIENAFDQKVSEYFQPNEGSKFYKGFQEYIVKND